ncbi:MAG TPA: hypothetical protein VL242_25470 [Sorangium sp.]|nr:hypothetical protein [Sorangium sp.]
MSALVPAGYATLEKRIALGLELIDAARGGRVALPIGAAIEKRTPSRGSFADELAPAVDRHGSCLFALVFDLTGKRPTRGAPRPSVTVRLTSRDRRFVPRRLRFELADPVELDPSEPGPDHAAIERLRAARSRRVALLPGAAYDAPGSSTGLRGRVLRGGAAVRWARVEARSVLPSGAQGPVIGRAHGDDRGEFFLLLGASPGPAAAASLSLPVEVTAFAPPPAPPPTAAQRRDPLWDLPVEPVTAPGPVDPISSGESLPEGYTASAPRTVVFRLGAILSSEVPPFVV